MQVKLFIFFIAILISKSSYSQKTVTIERNKGDFYKEIVNVLKSNTKVLHGPYKLLTYKRVLVSEGYYKFGQKDSLWTFYYPNGVVASKGYYKEDNKVETWENFSEDGAIIEILDSLAQDSHDRKYQKNDSLYYVLKDSLFELITLDVQPKYLGGNEELYYNISKNTRYPNSAIEKGINRTVYVCFILSKDGNVSNFSIYKPINDYGSGLNNAALKGVFNIPNKWEPGKLNGQKVTSMIIIPVRFKIK